MASLFVAYYRVSTQKQGASGLGLEAPRRDVLEHVRSRGGELIGEFQEVESGKKADRPELTGALERCRLTGARLLIAKLDRLSRNVAFLATLMEQGVPFVACDMPEANELTIHIMAAVAQAERKAISARTEAALGSIKAKLANGEAHVSRRSGLTLGRLGNPQGLSVSRPDLGLKKIKENADAHAAQIMPTIRPLKEEGLSLAAIAVRLADMRIKTPRGGAWTAMAVKRLLDRSTSQ